MRMHAPPVGVASVEAVHNASRGDCVMTWNRTNELPELTGGQLEVLQRFAHLEANIEDVCSSLAGVFEFNFTSELRTSQGHFKAPKPGVQIRREDLSRALEQRRLSLISERDLVCWATMILLNDAFELDSKDEDFIAEWLNDMSYNLDSR
jgi:hypothetical protein